VHARQDWRAADRTSRSHLLNRLAALPHMHACLHGVAGETYVCGSQLHVPASPGACRALPCPPAREMLWCSTRSLQMGSQKKRQPIASVSCPAEMPGWRSRGASHPLRQRCVMLFGGCDSAQQSRHRGGNTCGSVAGTALMHSATSSEVLLCRAVTPRSKPCQATCVLCRLHVKPVSAGGASADDVDALQAAAHTDLVGALASTYLPGSQPTGPSADPSGVSIFSWYPRIMRWRRFLSPGDWRRQHWSQTTPSGHGGGGQHTVARRPAQHQWQAAAAALPALCWVRECGPTNPKPYTFSDIVHTDECRELMDKARPQLARSGVSNAITGGSIIS
jgi:hypothetical protein